MAHVTTRLLSLLADAGPGGVAAEVTIDDAPPRAARLAAADAERALLRFDGAVPARPDREMRVLVSIDGRPRAFRPAAWSFVGHTATIDLPARLRVAQRRGTARVAAHGEAEVLLVAGDDLRRRPIVDLAGNGLGVAVRPGDRPLAPGTAVERLRFALPIGDPIVTSGTVKHTRVVTIAGVEREVLGIELSGLGVADAARLSAWVRGQAGPRARERRVLAEFGVGGARVHHDDRQRRVLHLTPGSVDVALDEADERVVEGRRWDAELWIEADHIATGILEVVAVQRHRGRPVRATLSWASLPASDRRRLVRLLGDATLVAVGSK